MPDRVAFPKPRDQKREPKPAFEVMGDGREICGKHDAGREEYKRRKFIMWARQGGLCRWCGLWMKRSDCTFDHQDGRGAGRRDDRLLVEGREINAALHLICNNLRGSSRAPYPFPKDNEPKGTP